MMAAVPQSLPDPPANLWSATAKGRRHYPELRGAVEADVAVIGGGYTGLSAALHLAEAGRRVVLLEAAQPGWGASGRNGGQVNPGLKSNPADIEARFGPDIGGRMVALAGGCGDLVFDLIARHGIACDATRPGWVRAATTPRALAALTDVARQWRARGADVDPLDADALAQHLGSGAYLGGLIDRRGGNLHPLDYAQGLAAAADRLGAQIYGNSRVTGLAAIGDSVRVTTTNGHVTAGHALICTNAYTGPLAPPLGRTFVPVTSMQVATAPLGDNLAGTILPEGHVVSDSRRMLLYFRKDAQGRFIIGGRGGSGARAVRTRQAALQSAAITLYPQLRGVDWPFVWGGEVALTRDHMLGLHRVAPHVMAALGYNGRGVGMATAMGKLLADWATGRPEAELDFPVTPVRPIPLHRFRRAGIGASVLFYSALDRIGV